MSLIAKPQVIPENIQKLLKEFEDVFPNELPNELPPKRAINFEVIPKPDAKPSARAPFRLSQVERNALDQFVEDLRKKDGLNCQTVHGHQVSLVYQKRT